MAQQLIIIGAADSKSGDNLFTGGTKINDNFTELYGIAQTGNNTVYLYSEDDLPNKTATTWTMDPNIPYKLAASFTTSLQCLPSAGASLSGDNVGSYLLSFSGSGSMFKGDDVDFYIHDINVDPGITNTAFEFAETVGNLHRFIAENTGVKNCAVWGKFTDLLIVQSINSNGRNCTTGVQLFGSNTIVSLSKFAFISTSATFVAVDMGTSISFITELDDLFVTAPVGAVGVSGLASSANIPANRLARVNGCEFLGGMTDLSGITVDDLRWVFSANTPTQDTLRDCLIYSASTLTTTIAVAETYVKLNATWSTDSLSGFTADATGRVTWTGERIIKVPVDLSVSIAPASGTGKTLRTRIAVNGTTLPNSTRTTVTDNGDASSLTTPWQLSLNQGDYIEAFVTSSDATNIECTGGILRVN